MNDFHTFLDYPDGFPFPGIVVPQKAYVSPTAYTCLPPIQFIENGRPGVLLSNALAQDFRGLQNSTDTPTLTERSMRVAMRISVCILIISFVHPDC